MERYEDILLSNWRRDPSFREGIDRIVLDECYAALQQIREILADDSLTDPECFMKIERLVCLYEDLGSNAGNRHDFG